MAGDDKNEAVSPKIRKKGAEEAAPQQAEAKTAVTENAPAAQARAPKVVSTPVAPSRRVVDPRAPSSYNVGPATQEEAMDTFEDVTTDDFAAMFEGSGFDAPSRRRVELGDQIEGKIVHIDKAFVFVDLGGRGEGRAPRAQYVDEQGELTVAVGEVRSFYVIKFTREGVVLGEQLDASGAGIEALEQAEASGLPLEGRVASRNKGGYVVEFGGAEAFCPISQIDLYRVEEDDLDQYIGKSYRFKVIEMRDGGRSAVVSRAALLREEAAERKKETMAKLQVGEIIEGTVRNIRDFGAFVDLGGLDGLVHVSELSWGGVDKPADVVSVGDRVEVKILEIEDRDGKDPRIGLSIKQAQSDPWDTVNEKFHVGQRTSGKVVRTAHFGAFVEIDNGLDGLVHVSEISWERVARPDEVVKVGDRVEVEILDIDVARRRIGLSMKALSGDPWAEAVKDFPVGSEITGAVEKVEDFGAFIALGAGVTALLPRSEMGLGRAQTPHSAYKVGAVVSAKVLSVEPERRRMALTVREDADFDGPRETSRRDTSKAPRKEAGYREAPSSGGFGTFGDLFKLKKD